MVIPTINFPPFRPYTNITPFTVRDGATYLTVLEELRNWLNTTLVPHVDSEVANLVIAWEDNANTLLANVITALNEQNDTVTAQLNAQNASILSQLNDQNAAITAQLAAQDASVTDQINTMTAYVDNAVQSIINSTIEVSDPVILGVLNDDESDSTAKVKDLVNATIETGLTPEAAQAIADRPEVDTAVASSIAERTGRVNLLDHATTPIGVGNADNDTAALVAAIEAARVAKTDVQIPPGLFTLNAEILLPNSIANQRKVGLIGAGSNVTKLKWSVDLGTDKFGIRTVTANTDVGICRIEGMTLEGPNLTRTFEESPCLMEGIEASRKMSFVDVITAYFKAGWRLNGDHISFLRCYVPSCYFGIYFKNASIDGDVSLIDCDLTGTVMASLGVGVGGRLSAFSMLRGHLGFSPYGIFIETGVASTISDPVVLGATFWGTSWESFGAAACWDEDAVGRWLSMNFYDTGNFSVYDTLAGVAYTPTRGRPALFRVGTMAYWKINGMGIGSGNTYPDAMFYVSPNAYGFDSCEFNAPAYNTLRVYIDNGKKIIAPTTGQGASRVDFAYRAGTERGFLRRLADQGPVTIGMLVAARTNASVQPNTLNSGRLVGVAKYAEDTPGAGVLVIEESNAVQVQVGAVTVSALEAFVVDQTNPTKIAPLSSAPTKPVIGAANGGNLLANTTQLVIFRSVMQ